MNRLETVVLEKSSYSPSVLADLLERISPFCGLTGNLHGKRVLLKPNLISPWAPLLACTESRFIVTVAQWFIEHGASVSVGDSPAFGSAMEVLRKRDAIVDLNRLGVKVVEFTSSRKYTLSDGIKVGLATEAIDCDLLVNLPKIKAHNQMYMTMAVKNIFGIVKGVKKSMLHMQHGHSHRKFAGILLDLQAYLPENISIADGIEVMHVTGPLGGKPLALGCVAASVNPYAVDTALLAALELSYEKSPLWLEAKRRRCPGVLLSELEFPFLRPNDFHGSGFMAPGALNPIRFNPLRFLYGHLKRMILAIRS
jgi:uncharacterized protein (DUF362 family)